MIWVKFIHNPLGLWTLGESRACDFSEVVQLDEVVGCLPLELVEEVVGVLLKLALEDVCKVRFDEVQGISEIFVSGLLFKVPVNDTKLLTDHLSILILASWFEK